MFRLFALIAVVLVVGYIWWSTKQIRKEHDNETKNYNN